MNIKRVKLIDQLINSTLHNNFSFKNHTTSTEKHFTFTKRSLCDKKNSKIQMRYGWQPWSDWNDARIPKIDWMKATKE